MLKKGSLMTKKKIILLITTIFILLAGLIAFSIWSSYSLLQVNTYELDTDKIDEELRVVVIADLHEHEFGENNEELITEIKAQNPEIILMAGDFINNDSENVEFLYALIGELKDISTVCYALGNHELTYMETADIDLVEELEAAGAVVLEKEYVDIDVNGQEVRIGGMYDYAFGTNGSDEAAAAPQEIKDFLTDFQDTDNFKIMLSHRPDSFIFGDASTAWDVDLVVSGHLHGGQVVLPIFGGIYGGDQGYFPEYVHGLYTKDNMQIFVTSGLGSNPKKVPRFNNRPEIAVITLY